MPAYSDLDSYHAFAKWVQPKGITLMMGWHGFADATVVEAWDLSFSRLPHNTALDFADVDPSEYKQCLAKIGASSAFVTSWLMAPENSGRWLYIPMCRLLEKIGMLQVTSSWRFLHACVSSRVQWYA